jgi:hypothetical protein
MSCERARSLLSEQFERSLNPDELNVLRDHLNTCASCSRFSETLRSGMAGLAALPSIPANPRIRSAVDGVSAGKRGQQPWALRRLLGQSMEVATAVAVLTLVATLMFVVAGGQGRPLQDMLGLKPVTEGSPGTSGPVSVLAPMSASDATPGIGRDVEARDRR